ncbi:hypothetical protein M2401_000867 [Pseudomonas sp. JUb42]|jgi:hypothetical protein|uniref:hypothetical protein n=1 Tax=Pseudomonas sp. JUb42 TaxID=2940611 RepID=UPI00216A412B|nr:hypothetical protein [Pseudomonas sp. JUb42]MCS3467146.1 hypothetical protein [Pseudomonas sp. JUb42]
MTQHNIYDEYKGLRLWNYMTCERDEENREVWQITVEVRRGRDEVVIPAVEQGQTYVDRMYAQAAGREIGKRLVDEAGL